MNKMFKAHLTRLKRVRTSQGRDIQTGLCLDRNERVVPLPEENLREIRGLITSPLLSCYPESTQLYVKLAEWYHLKEDQIYITNGITEGINFLYETLTNPGDEVVVTDPTYPMYKVYGDIYQVLYRPAGFNGLDFDLEGLYGSISDRTAFVALPNPNLPIEYCLDLKELRKIAQKCLAHNAYLIVDEAYGFFGAESALPLIGEFENVIVCQTLSKAFGLAGIRVGFILSGRENIDYISKTRSLNESNSVSMAVAEYMIDHADIMKSYVKETKKGRDFIRGRIEGMGLKWYGSDNTNAMLIFLENNDQVNDAVSYLKSKKIYVRASFDAPLDRAVRITLGPEESMKVFFKEFKLWYQQRMAGV